MIPLNFEHSPRAGHVSVVIPAHRAESFIGKALESIAAQTFQQWEVIVVEDGSPDGTRAIVEDFGRRHRGHRVVYAANDRNYGPSHSRNVAFALAAGEFVALLDADDRWFPDHLQSMVDAISLSGNHIAYSSLVMIEDGSGLLLGVWGPDHEDLKSFPYGLFSRNFITPSGVVLRRQVLADVGPWDVDLRLCEDLSFWMRCLAAGKKFEYVSGCHCLYLRNRDGAATNKVCAVQEAFAGVIERNINLPGLKTTWCRRYASVAYARAGQLHATTDLRDDTTADPSRAARLMIKAWTLRPKRVGHLARAALYAAKSVLRRWRPLPTPAAPPVVRTSVPIQSAA